MDKPKIFFHQGNLEHLVRKLFPDQKVESNSRRKSDIKNPATGYYLELDDLYHYISTWDHQMPLSQIQNKDGLKHDAVLERGDTLLVVPFWWDGSERGLIDAIQFARPDLLSDVMPLDSRYLLSLNPPESIFKYGNVPDVGALMLASFPPLTSTFVNSISPDDPWWYGEKYDGVRSCWNPVKKILYSRWGIDQQVFPAFASHFPGTFLDGEIWFGRGSFIEAIRVMALDLDIVDWPNLRFVAFDYPHPSAFENSFELRYQSLLSTISHEHPFLVNAPRILCVEKRQLTAATQEIIDSGGEGLVLRKPFSTYQHGRSSDLVKLKVTRGDVEALVADVVDQNSAKLQLPDGMTFEMELAPEFSGGKIRRGDVVTLAYDSYSARGVPKNPKIHRIRSDVTWEQVVVDYSMKTPQSQSISETTRKMSGTYWSSDKSDERAFFEKIAKRQKFDPLVPENWYTVSEAYVKRQQGSKEVLEAHEGQFSTALISSFPDIGLQDNLFKYKSVVRWGDPASRRKCFIGMAEQRDFDPLVASNWYTLKTAAFDAHFNMLSWYYKGSFINALIHLFPEVGFEKEKFSSVPNRYWAEICNRRAAFDAFAKKKQFDPLTPANWYKLSRDDLSKIKRKGSILYYYKGRFSAALVHLYPEIDLKRYRFSFVQRTYWNKSSHRRQGLEEFARDHQFDPLVPDNWYPIQLAQARQYTSIRCILGHHNDSIRQAVMDLFPEIGLQIQKFITSCAGVKKIRVDS